MLFLKKTRKGPPIHKILGERAEVEEEIEGTRVLHDEPLQLCVGSYHCKSIYGIGSPRFELILLAIDCITTQILVS